MFIQPNEVIAWASENSPENRGLDEETKILNNTNPYWFLLNFQVIGERIVIAQPRSLQPNPIQNGGHGYNSLHTCKLHYCVSFYPPYT